MNSAHPVRWKRPIIATLLFGISFGYVEAAVVTYLRPQFEAVRATFAPPSRDLFPLLSPEQVRAAGPDMVRLVVTEIAREAATLVMLGAVAAVAGGNFRQWFAFFMLGFGAWDISYYVFLKVLIDWPESLLAWDILFLIPVPWSGPVLAPALVALTMVGTGLVYLWRESNGHPIRMSVLHWLGAYVGAMFVLASFIWDYRNVMAGGMPKPFHWPLFALGEIIWLVAFLHWLSYRGSQRTGRPL
ncbi:MAG: hypothetical protein ACLQVG_26060 [Terriglobia bacterium]